MSLCNNLKATRTRVGMSQELVADRLNVSRQAVTKWEAGQSKPSAQNLQALAELYGVSSEELLNAQQKSPNLILRVNLTRWAIILQTAFLCSSAHFANLFRRNLNDAVYQWSFIFSLAVLVLCSTWATTNHRYEPDKEQRRKNINIELGYCCLQLLVALFTIFRGLGLVGVALILLITFAYILYINPKFMNRKLTG